MMTEILGPQHEVVQTAAIQMRATEELENARDTFHMAAIAKATERYSDRRREVMFLTLVEAKQREKEMQKEAEAETVILGEPPAL